MNSTKVMNVLLDLSAQYFCVDFVLFSIVKFQNLWKSGIYSGQDIPAYVMSLKDTT